MTPSAALSPAERDAVRSLCTEAYGEEFGPYLASIGPGVHLCGEVDGELVSHAMWVTRWLQPGDHALAHAPLRTAYVEAVATSPRHRGRGFARAILVRLLEELRHHDYALAALSPSDERFYAPLGWEPWRGPLSVRTAGGGRQPTPDEGLMIHRLPATPDLALEGPMSIEWRDGEIW